MKNFVPVYGGEDKDPAQTVRGNSCQISNSGRVSSEDKGESY